MNVLRLLLVFLCVSTSASAEDSVPNWARPSRKQESFATGQIATNFGIVYATQWAFYAVDQRMIIDKHGSFDNWIHNPFKPTFDKDSFDYNIFKHTLSGAGYYLWYRSRRYERRNAFIWSFLSSLAFEFTIETITERPSYQDIYQTPVFGTVLGIGADNLARYLHSLDTWYGTIGGYLLNPFMLLPQQGENTLAVVPLIDNNTFGYVATYRF
jgi:Domain of unknown function (DUF3943)